MLRYRRRIFAVAFFRILAVEDRSSKSRKNVGDVNFLIFRVHTIRRLGEKSGDAVSGDASFVLAEIPRYVSSNFHVCATANEKVETLGGETARLAKGGPSRTRFENRSYVRSELVTMSVRRLCIRNFQHISFEAKCVLADGDYRRFISRKGSFGIVSHEREKYRFFTSNRKNAYYSWTLPPHHCILIGTNKTEFSTRSGSVSLTKNLRDATLILTWGRGALQDTN